MLVKRIQNIALQLHGGHAAKFAFEARLYHVAQFAEILKANLLGELIIDHCILGGFNEAHGGGKFSRLSCQISHTIGIRECDIDGQFIARLFAGELIFKPGNELV